MFIPNFRFPISNISLFFGKINLLPMYKKFDSLNLPQIDKEILEFWEQNQIFEKSVNLDFIH